MLLFSFYIAKEINHDCVGDNCPICQEISICENILRNISNDIAINGFVFIYTYISYKIILLYNPIFSKITLVSLKVKTFELNRKKNEKYINMKIKHFK